jgi:hypothetical protein
MGGKLFLLELVVVPGRKAEFYGNNPSVKLSLSQGAPGDRKGSPWGWVSLGVCVVRQALPLTLHILF